MNIELKLTKDFERRLNAMTEKYGEDFLKLNGLDDSKLGFTDFIDNFIDSDNVANASIDPSANVGHKDIVSLINEMPKPHQKLLAYNKLYYEIKKKYGYRTANEWFEAEWNKALYLHDAHTSTFFSYCFTGDTKIMTKEGVKRLDELVGKDIMVLNKNHGWEPGTVQHFGRQPIKRLVLERYGATKEINVTGNHLWFVRTGKTSEHPNTILVSTDDLQPGMRIPYNTSKAWSLTKPSPFGVAHGFFTGDGHKCDYPRANFCGDKIALLPYFTPADVTGTDREYTTYGIPKYFNDLPSLDETSTYLYGWLAGYFAADGCVDKRGRCTLASCDIKTIAFAKDVLCVLGMPTPEIRYQDRVSNLTGEMSRIYTISLNPDCLREDFFIRPTHKESFVQAHCGVHHDRVWTVKSVMDLGYEDEVYCAVVPGTESFTLDGNVLTHNCFAYDLKDVAEKGLFFIETFNAEPPRHLESFVDMVKEHCSFCCNRSAGAVAYPNLIPYMWYFWNKDRENGYYLKTPEIYAEQQIQRLIYSLNQPFLRGGIQSA